MHMEEEGRDLLVSHFIKVNILQNYPGWGFIKHSSLQI
jgi:hypothetical protein